MESENDILIRFFRNLRAQEKARDKVLDLLSSSEEFSICTYQFGYTEQMVYLCKSCFRQGGICTGCMLNCHKGHEIIEIGPKKNFRCDCGLEKTICHLNPKRGINSNIYNHNFQGKFCFCDIEDNEQTRHSDMHLCISCYDWFHQDCISIYNDCHNLSSRKFHQKVLPSIPPDTSNFFFLCEKCVQFHLYIPNNYLCYVYLEQPLGHLENNIEKYPYNIFVHKNWLNPQRVPESQDLHIPDYQQRVLKKFSEADLQISSDEESFEFTGSHEQQINLAHGLCALRELLSTALQEDLRVNLRSELRDFTRKAAQVLRRTL